MPTLQVRVWAENAGVGVSQWAAETMGIWQGKGGLTTQQIDNKVRERVGEISQSMSIINQQGAGLEQWDLLIDHCVTRISELESKRPLWKRYMADKTNLDSRKLKAALDGFAEVGLRWTKNRLEETPTKKRKLVLVGMYFITPMLILLFLMMCSSRRRPGRNLGSQVFADKCALRRLERFPCRATELYHRLYGFRHCWEQGWVKTILSYSHGTCLGRMNRYFWYLHQSSIWPFCQSRTLQSPVCQTPTGKSESYRAAWRSLMEMVVCTPMILPQSSITILLPDG